MSENFFFELGKHQRLVKKNQSIASLFEVAFDLTESFDEITGLQKEFLISEMLFNYLFFGTCLFTKPSLDLISIGLEKIAKIPSDFFLKYTYNLKSFLEEEAPISPDNVFTEKMESQFAKEYIKRIFTTEPQEDVQTGFHIFDPFYTNKLRRLANTILAEMTKEELDLKKSELLFQEQTRDTFFHPYLEIEFWNFLNKVQKDALIFITSRLNSFIRFQNKNQHGYYLLKKDSAVLEETSRRISSLMTLYLLESNKQPIFKDNLVSVSQLLKIFSSKSNSTFRILQNLAHWLQEENELQLKDSLKSNLDEAVNCGVLFKIPHGKNDFYYGLSDVGSHILKPYSEILKQSFSQ